MSVASRPPSTDAAQLALQLRSVLARLNRQLRRTVETAGVPPGQYSVLVALLDHSPVSVSDLAEHEGVRAPSMTVTVSQLEAAGLVTKRQAASDRRFVEVAITPLGAEVASTARELQGSWFQTRLKRLPVAEARAIRAALPYLEHLATMEEL